MENTFNYEKKRMDGLPKGCRKLKLQLASRNQTIIHKSAIEQIATKNREKYATGLPEKLQQMEEIRLSLFKPKAKEPLRFPFIARASSLGRTETRRQQSRSLGASKGLEGPPNDQSFAYVGNTILEDCSNAGSPSPCFGRVEYLRVDSYRRRGSLKDIKSCLGLAVQCAQALIGGEGTRGRPLRRLDNEAPPRRDKSSSITKISQFFVNTQGPLSRKAKEVIQNRIGRTLKLRL